MDKNEVLAKVKYIWEKQPDMRLGQLFCSCANYGALYYSTNEQLLETMAQKYGCNITGINALYAHENETRTETYEQQINALKTQICALEARLNAPSPNKGRVYIYKNDQVKSVEKNLLDNYLKEGWRKGRGPKN